MKRVLTLDKSNRESLLSEIIAGQRSFAISYSLVDLSNNPYDIVVSPNKIPLAKFLNKRLKQWSSDESYPHTANPKSILSQKTKIGNHLVMIIKEEELMGKNIKFSCGEYIYDSDKKNHQDLVVSEVNPFIVLYSFEKEKLIDLVDTDFDTIKLSVNADLTLETKKKLLAEETVYKYGFTVPINKIKEGIHFDIETGVVLLKGKKLGILKANTRPYKFFHFLYTNQGKYKTFKEICDGIDSGQREIEKVVSDIKREIPKEITDLIHTGKGSYKLIGDKEISP
ncbi:hypothetical protein KBD33_04245 [Candidatus Gracilibacteria bacterium]|nr:hypothetical protein [Candidatus Gracilibacteria bacterium]